MPAPGPPPLPRILSPIAQELTAQVKSDVTAALKAGDKARVGALRLVLSELQKAAKEGDADEQAVLRRERKRRLDSAQQYRDGGRPELAEAEESEAVLIASYLPSQLSDAELDTIVADAIAATGASEPKDMGKAIGAAMKAAAGRADGKRVSERVKAALAG